MPLRPAWRSAWLLGGIVALAGLAFLLVTGVSAAQAALSVVVVGIQAAAGGTAWSWIRRWQAGPVELLGMGLALGTSSAVLCGLASQLVGLGYRGWLLPALLVSVIWVIRLLRSRSRTSLTDRHSGVAVSAGWLDRPSVLALVATGVLGVLSFVPNLMSYPLTWVGTWSRYHADMLFFESLGTSLAQLGPLDSIFTPDGLIRYHWLVYAWSGQVSALSDADGFVILTRVLPFVAVLGSCLVAICWARKLSKVWWVPTLAVVLLILGGYVGATYGVVFNFDSPSQAMTMLWLLACSWAVVTLLEQSSLSGRAFAAWLVGIGILVFSLAGGKISAGVVAAAAIVFVGLTGLVLKSEWRRRALIVSAVAVVAFVAGYILIVSGSANPGGLRILNVLDRASSVQGLNPIQGSSGILLGTVIMIVAIIARWSGLGWLLVDRAHRRSPSTILALGFALAGLATVVLLSGGLNDTWFALAASAPIAVVSAAGVGEAAKALVGQRSTLRVLIPAIAIAVVIYVVVTLLWLTGASGGNVWVSTLRWAGPLVAVLGAVLGGILISRTSGHAAEGAEKPTSWPRRSRWFAGTVVILVLISAPGRLLGVGSGQVGVQPGLSSDAFAPIIQYVPGIDTSSIHEWSDTQVSAGRLLKDRAGADDLLATNVSFSPLVPALSGVATLASGVLYQAPYGRKSGIEPLLTREAESWAFIDSPNESTVSPLCAAGVDWLWVDPAKAKISGWEPWASVVLTEPDVTLLAVNPGTCLKQ